MFPYLSALRNGAAKPCFRGPARVSDTVIWGLKLAFLNYADDAFFSSHLLRVAMAHDVSDHTPQVLLVIPVLPLELTDPKLNGFFALSRNPVETFFGIAAEAKLPTGPQQEKDSWLRQCSMQDSCCDLIPSSSSSSSSSAFHGDD